MVMLDTDNATVDARYSSLAWVLLQWAHFTVRRFIYVYVFVFCVFSYCLYVVLL